MADSLRIRDPFAFGEVLGAPNILGTPSLRAGANAFGQPATIAGMRAPRDDFGFPDESTTTTGLPGSPLNTLYGVDSESYLTDEQKRLARQIQGKFDASLDSRDRALQRYGAPQLSSFVEDEALARAMSLARGLNTPAADTSVLNSPPIRTQAPFPRGSTASGPTTPTTPSRTGAQTAAEWQRIMTGLASVAPLLFGKDAYGAFINKGLFPSIKEALFGKDVAPTISDAQLEKMVTSGEFTSGPMQVNPFTGMPIGQDYRFEPPQSSIDLGDPYYGGGEYVDWSTDISPPDVGWDFGLLGGP